MKEASVPLLLYRIAVSGFPEIAHEIFNIFTKSEEHLLNYYDNFPLNYISPLEVSVGRNDEDMFAYLLKIVNIPVERLILTCLLGKKLSPTDIKKRSNIFGRILAKNRDKEWTVKSQDIVSYLDSYPRCEVLNPTQWIDFAFHHNINLYELPTANKVALLEMAIYRSRDNNIFQLLHLLFGKNGILRHVLPCFIK